MKYPKSFDFDDLHLVLGKYDPDTRYWGKVVVRSHCTRSSSSFWVEWGDIFLTDSYLFRAGLRLVEEVRSRHATLPEEIAALHKTLQLDGDAADYGFLWEEEAGIWRFHVPVIDHAGTLSAERTVSSGEVCWQVGYADTNLENGRDLCLATRPKLGEAIAEALRMAADFPGGAVVDAVTETEHWVGEFRSLFDLTYGNPRVLPMSPEEAEQLLLTWGFEREDAFYLRPWEIREHEDGWALSHEQDNIGGAYAYRARSLPDLLRMPVAPGVPVSVYDTIRPRGPRA